MNLITGQSKRSFQSFPSKSHVLDYITGKTVYWNRGRKSMNQMRKVEKKKVAVTGSESHNL